MCVNDDSSRKKIHACVRRTVEFDTIMTLRRAYRLPNHFRSDIAHVKRDYDTCCTCEVDDT